MHFGVGASDYLEMAKCSKATVDIFPTLLLRCKDVAKYALVQVYDLLLDRGQGLVCVVSTLGAAGDPELPHDRPRPKRRRRMAAGALLALGWL